jgi:hypothetical protein
MQWGTFIEAGTVHVVPADAEGYIADGHMPDELCLCDPEVEEINGVMVVIHNVEQ